MKQRGVSKRYEVGKQITAHESILIRVRAEWRCVRSITCSRVPVPRVPRAGSMMRPRMPRTMRASSRPKATTAEYIHNKVAYGDDYSCDRVYDGNEHLCERAGVNKGRVCDRRKENVHSR